MTTTSSGGRDEERRLLRLVRSLGPENRRTLLAFAEFLAQRDEAQSQEEQVPREPEPQPRPKKESVVGAIKRLSKSYYMLDRSAMLNDTSSLMAGHIIRGRPAAEVIDELEVLFARQYAKYREENEQKQ